MDTLLTPQSLLCIFWVKFVGIFGFALIPYPQSHESVNTMPHNMPTFFQNFKSLIYSVSIYNINIEIVLLLTTSDRIYENPFFQDNVLCRHLVYQMYCNFNQKTFWITKNSGFKSIKITNSCRKKYLKWMLSDNTSIVLPLNDLQDFILYSKHIKIHIFF